MKRERGRGVRELKKGTRGRGRHKGRRVRERREGGI